MMTSRQQDKLRGWLHLVKKKTSRISTRITASLGLIALTRDEQFEQHYDNFRLIEKTVRSFIKNLAAFVEHFEHFLVALQQTSDNLDEFYRNKSHKRELDELKKKNKMLASDHFRTFKRTIERQVVGVLSQLLQKFGAPHQLVNKRSAKLLDFDKRSHELESCRDPNKQAALRNQYVIAKDIYDRINRQLILELPVFNQCALDIFKECILVLLENRKSLITAYTNQTASLLDTPLMMTYTASGVTSNIMMSCDPNYKPNDSPTPPATTGSSSSNGQRQGSADGDGHRDELYDQDRKDSGHTSSHEFRLNSTNEEDTSRPQSAASRLCSSFNQMAMEAREISSTPLSQVSKSQLAQNGFAGADEPDAGLGTSDGLEVINKSPLKVDPSETMNSESDWTNKKQQELQQPKEQRRRKKKPQIYIATWPFVATDTNQLTIVSNQPLKLVKDRDECGNDEWSLVQDKKGQLGYVPSSYIKKKE